MICDGRVGFASLLALAAGRCRISSTCSRQKQKLVMYALRQPTSPLFGNLGAVVLPEHADATNYVFLNAHGDHEAQLRRASEK